jgi:hypothetical protein
MEMAMRSQLMAAVPMLDQPRRPHSRRSLRHKPPLPLPLAVVVEDKNVNQFKTNNKHPTFKNPVFEKPAVFVDSL